LLGLVGLAPPASPAPPQPKASAPASAGPAAAPAFAPSIFGNRALLVRGKGPVAGLELKLPLALELRIDAP
jgi:hypothetical protein